MNGLAALVPVFNEVATVDRVVARVQALPFVHQVVVVDDGSADGSRERVAALARRYPGVVARFHPTNRGKGAALRTALEAVEVEAVVVQDADLEYDPGDLWRLMEHLAAGAEAVYGSRMLGRRWGMGWPSAVANRLLTALFNRLYGACLTDLETGYKACATDLLRRVGIASRGFAVDPELSAKLVRAGARIVEVPISYRARGRRAGKKIRARDGVAAVATLARYRLWRPPAGDDGDVMAVAVP